MVTGWDATHTKLIVANTAKSTSPTWPSSTGRSPASSPAPSWVEPLDNGAAQVGAVDLKNTDAAFQSGGHTYAACYSNDFRVSMYNKKMFAKAGISAFPTTLAELATDVQKLKASGVKYPLAIPMAATEGGVTPWYLLTLAMGGQLFDNNLKPSFQSPNSAGYKALQWEANALKQGWVSPGSVSMDDTVAFNNFTAGQNAIVLATGPGNMATANDPSQSSIAGQAALGPGARPQRPGRVVRPARGPVDPGHGQAQGGRRGLHRVVGEARPTRSRSTRRRAACRAAPPPQAAGSSGQLQGGDVLNQRAVARRPAVPVGRADLVLAVQLRRAGPAERGRQGPDEHP